MCWCAYHQVLSRTHFQATLSMGICRCLEAQWMSCLMNPLVLPLHQASKLLWFLETQFFLHSNVHTQWQSEKAEKTKKEACVHPMPPSSTEIIKPVFLWHFFRSNLCLSRDLGFLRPRSGIEYIRGIYMVSLLLFIQEIVEI